MEPWPWQQLGQQIALLTAIVANTAPEPSRDGKSESRYVYRRGNGGGGMPDPRAMGLSDFWLDFTAPPQPPMPEEGSAEWWDLKGAEHAAVMDKWRLAIAGQLEREPDRAGWSDEDWRSE